MLGREVFISTSEKNWPDKPPLGRMLEKSQFHLRGTD